MPAHSLRPGMLGRGMRPHMDLIFTGASLPAGFTFSRASVATDGLYTDAPGSSYNTYAIDQPRLVGSRGYLQEATRQQRLRNSAAPANHTTFNLGATTYSFWMIGTGTATIEPNTAVGTGWTTISAGMWANIVITTVGTANITISGSVDRFQLEAGQWPGSFIESTTTSVIRSADLCSAPFPFRSWRQMSLLGDGVLTFNPSGVANQWLAHIGDGAVAVGFGIKHNASAPGIAGGASAGGDLDMSGLVVDQDVQLGFSANGAVISGVGMTGGQKMPFVSNSMYPVSGTTRNLIGMYIGSLTAGSTQGWSGFIKRVRYWGFPITPRQFEQMMRE